MEDGSDTYCRVTLVGNVGSDPLIRYLDETTCMASLSIATDSMQPDTPGGVVTDWHQVVCYGTPAHYTETHIRKGFKVRVVGRLSYRKYRVGEDRYRRQAVIIGEEMTLLSKPKSPSAKRRTTGQAEAYQTYLDTLSHDAESDLPF